MNSDIAMITHYLDLGYALIPCGTDKAPTCPHGLKDAADTPEAWRDLSDRYPARNVAIVVPLGTMVLDLDVDVEHGLDGIEAMLRILGRHDGRAEDWPGPWATTPRGGVHLWCLMPPGWEGGNRTGALPRGIDVRSNGRGYVLVAPSRTEHGAYRWGKPLVPAMFLPQCPAEVAALLRATPPRPEPRALPPAPPRNGDGVRRERYAAAALDRACAEIQAASVGERNETLNRVALGIGSLCAGGVIPESDARSRLHEAAITAGLTERETRATLDSGLRAGAREPRGLPPSDRPERQHHVGGIPVCDAPPPPSDADAPPEVIYEAPAAKPDTISAEQAIKREIHITTHEEEVTAQVIDALAGDETLWQRDPGNLVSIRRQVEGPRTKRPDGTEGDVIVQGAGKLAVPVGTPLVWRLSNAIVRERISRRCVLQKWHAKAEEWIACHPPDWLTPMVADRPSWDGIRYLRGIVEHPVLRPDGTVLSAHGYDDSSCLYVSETAPQVETPASPTREQAQASASRLLDVVQDFPWRDLRSQGAWLCALLTPIARYAIDGPTPLFVVDANIRGAGKTLLCDVIGLALTGRTIPAQTYPGSDDAELEKILMSCALAGVRMINWDNVEGMIGSACLDKWLTTTHASGRVLGASQQVSMRWDTVMYATSNNASIRADSDRRCIHIKLKSDLEHPEHRSDFHAADLHAHVLDHRAEIIGHALTILGGHLAAGRPTCGGRPKGSFMGWAGIVRDAVLWCGLPDAELAPDDESRPQDVGEGMLSGLMDGVEDVGGADGCTTGQLVRAVEAYHQDRGSCPETLVHAAESACGGHRVNAVGLGRKLQMLRDRWLRDRCLVSEHDAKNHRNVWRVITRNRGE